MRILCMLIFVFFVSSLYAQEMTFNEMKSCYDYNSSQFIGARVLFREIVQTTMQNNKNESFKQEWLFDYWTDKNNLLIRGGDSGDSTDEKFLLSFPAVNFSENELISLYKNTHIFSFYEEQSRYWMGYSGKEASATIGKRIFPIGSNSFIFPPFLAFRCENKNALFPTDFFISVVKNEGMKVYKADNEDTPDCYVVEIREPTRLSVSDCQSMLKNTKYENRNICLINLTILWIDVKKGAIPFRIVKREAFCEDDVILNDDFLSKKSWPDSKCNYYFEISKISECQPGVFYPQKAKLIQYRGKLPSYGEVYPHLSDFIIYQISLMENTRV